MTGSRAPLAQGEVTLPPEPAATETAGARGEAPAEEPVVGEAIGRYVVLERVGAGGMGVVYAAYDPELDRKIAIKLLLPEGVAPKAGRDRLLREAQALARLNHPNVVTIHDVGAHQGRVYLAMEFVAGRSLRAWAASARPWRETLSVLFAAGRGLAAAHAHGLVHRDFKPDNVMVTQSGRPLVTDFGLARAVADAPDSTGDVTGRGESTASTVATQGGVLLGTPAYMAPEHFASGAAADARSDQFAFCVTCWEVLLGKRPFSGSSSAELAYAVSKERPRVPDAARPIPPWLRQALERGLERDPARRWPSMDALLDTLDRRAGRRRGLRPLAGLLGVAAVAGAVWLATEPQRCGGAQEQLAEVWNDARAEGISEAMLGTGAPFAPRMREQVGADLRAYAETWVEGYGDACEATRVRGEQSESVMDMRMACLHAARRRLDAVLTVLERLDAASLARAHEIVDGLPELDRCRDIDALLGGVAPPEPEEVEAVDAADALLAEAEAEREAGHYDASMRLLGRVEAERDGVRYGPLHTRIALARGETLIRQGEFEAAADELRRAQELAGRERQWDELAEATLSLLWVVGVAQGKTDEAERQLGLAEGLVAGSPDQQIVLAGHRAAIARVQGHYDETIAGFREVLRYQLEQHGPDDRRVAAAHNGLAEGLEAAGKYTEALAEHREVLRIRELALGERHPEVGAARAELGALLGHMGRLEDAEVEHRSAIAILVRALGEEHPNVAAARYNLGIVLRREGKLQESETELRAALEAGRAAFGKDHQSVAAMQDGLGQTLLALGDFDGAEAMLRGALAIQETALGPDHPEVGTGHNNLSLVLYAKRDFEGALQASRAGLANHEAALGREHPQVFKERSNLGAVLRSLGRDEEAEAEHRAATEGLTKLLGADHTDVARVKSELARLILEKGRRAEALPLLEECWSVQADAGVTPFEKAVTAFGLARALGPESKDRAVTLARTALDLFREAGPAHVAHIPRVEAWLQEHA